MEIEKRKRSPEKDDRKEEDQAMKLTTKEREEGGGGGGVVVVPTEEEVEEFFAIVGRMQVAVKYFEKSVGDGNGGRRGTWRALLESAEEEEEEGLVVGLVGGDRDRDDQDDHDCDQVGVMVGGDRLESAKKKKRTEESNRGLDLNAVPLVEQEQRERSI